MHQAILKRYPGIKLIQINKNIKLLIIFLPVLLFVIFPDFCHGQKNQKFSKEDYVDNYHELAIKEMKRTGIPASITLAQGIHESDCGNSILAVEGNNHFGIKCHASWDGEKMYKDDDRKDECFRKYKSAYESYRDHSDFIKNSKRYSFLFGLPGTDYKAWAYGLKKAGYATNPKYPELIIAIIEDNNLAGFDKGITVPVKKDEGGKTKGSDAREHEVSRKNRVNSITVRKGDTFFKIGEEFNRTIRYLHRCNDMGEDDMLKEGQVLYLDKKRNRAERGIDFHTVRAGETLHSISQLYGVKLKKLIKKNRLKPGDQVRPGDKLSLRKKKHQ